VVGLADTTVFKKVLMAISGLILWGFVIVHMIGNLKVYQGPVAFNHYAEGLRTLGEPFFGRSRVLWIARVILLAAVGVHVVAAVQLFLKSRAARKVGYQRFDSLGFSFASRTMVWGGLVILAFVIYHLLHMTFGNVHPDFRHGDAYHNFVVGFQSVPVALAYSAAMIPLGFHLYHGVWSALQTLGANQPAYERWRRPAAAVLAVFVVVANLSFPIAVLAGLIRPVVPGSGVATAGQTDSRALGRSEVSQP
jgi:succinate dehydrogenase / fumarate reductase cytochrome b subunit